MNHKLVSLIKEVAGRHDLPPELVQAVVQVESAGQACAWNPEPHYRYLVDCRTGKPFRKLTREEQRSKIPPEDFPCLGGDRDQEWWAQQASWGLMQVMGAVARERGFVGPYLPELCNPEVGLEYGCRHLAMFTRRFYSRFGWAAVCAAYNGGSGAVRGKVEFLNPEYPAKVLCVLGGNWPA